MKQLKKPIEISIDSLHSNISILNPKKHKFELSIFNNKIEIDFELKELNSSFSVLYTMDILNEVRHKYPGIRPYNLAIKETKDLELNISTKFGEPVIAYYYELKYPWLFTRL